MYVSLRIPKTESDHQMCSHQCSILQVLSLVQHTSFFTSPGAPHPIPVIFLGNWVLDCTYSLVYNKWKCRLINMEPGVCTRGDIPLLVHIHQTGCTCSVKLFLTIFPETEHLPYSKTVLPIEQQFWQILLLELQKMYWIPDVGYEYISRNWHL